MESGPILLAADTSGSRGSVAILQGTKTVAQYFLDADGQRHAQALVSQVDRVLKQNQLVPGDIDAVAFSVGPGSFTGLRVGVVFAKTFVWLNQKRLVAVDTLRAIAQRVPTDIEVVTAISDAQRGEVFAASYRLDGNSGVRIPVDEVHVTNPLSLPPETVLTEPGLGRHRDRLSKHTKVPCTYKHGSAARDCSKMPGTLRQD